ncbi:MAG: hypothetical protein PHP44_06675 [Kiritimatiellae bacterium]|nr:hypothetical protein [Kiritimatiellia bacterium]
MHPKITYFQATVVLLALTLLVACHGADHELTLQDALEQGRCRELIRLYESKLSSDPDYLPYQLNLSVMYALSSRLDADLDVAERDRRSAEAIRLAKDAFNTQQAENQPDLEALLYSGSTLAQVYAVLGATNMMREVFAELSSKMSWNNEALERIAHGKNLLENRLAHGYPLDVANPFGDSAGDSGSGIKK